jgi:hypothetical protein
MQQINHYYFTLPGRLGMGCPRERTVLATLSMALLFLLADQGLRAVFVALCQSMKTDDSFWLIFRLVD